MLVTVMLVTDSFDNQEFINYENPKLMPYMFGYLDTLADMG